MATCRWCPCSARPVGRRNSNSCSRRRINRFDRAAVSIWRACSVVRCSSMALADQHCQAPAPSRRSITTSPPVACGACPACRRWPQRPRRPIDSCALCSPCGRMWHSLMQSPPLHPHHKQAHLLRHAGQQAPTTTSSGPSSSSSSSSGLPMTRPMTIPATCTSACT